MDYSLLVGVHFTEAAASSDERRTVTPCGGNKILFFLDHPFPPCLISSKKTHIIPFSADNGGSENDSLSRVSNVEHMLLDPAG